MSDAVERALEAARNEGPSFLALENDPLPTNSYAAGYEAGMREMLEAFPRMWAAANRSLSADPPAEMVDAANNIYDTAPAIRRGLSAALTRLADIVESSHTIQKTP